MNPSQEPRPDASIAVLHLVALVERLHPSMVGRLARVRLARNEQFVSLGEPIAAGDVIALIPPIAGG